jgi:hypothetical protein
VFFGATGDPVLQKPTPVYQYGPNTWGPAETVQVTPPGGWQDPLAHDRAAVTGKAA